MTGTGADQSEAGKPRSQIFRILAADELASQGLAWIEAQADAELFHRPGLDEPELAAIVGQHDAMIVRSGVQITAAVLENPGQLKVIARAGVGVDNIDLEAATAKGILVVNSAEASTITTAEHAFALMLGLVRHLGPAHQSMTGGGWERGKFRGRQLSGKTLGVVGLGRVGRLVAERGLAFGMEVVAYDPFYNADTALDGKVLMHRCFVDLLPHADILTFHVPLNQQTRGMLNGETFAAASEGLYVVNTSRGGVVDEPALVDALASGRCGGAALDVFTEEPLAEDHPLRASPNVLLTPHLGASTVEAQNAVSIDAAASALGYLRGEGVKGAVNAPGLRLDLSPLQQSYADLAQRMTVIIDPMITSGIEEVSVEVSGHHLASAAETLERTVLVGLLGRHLATPVNVVNICHVAEQRGIVTRTIIQEEDKFGPRLVIEVRGGEQARRIVGRVYDDLKPRVVEINGYHMDMIPAGSMVLVQNDDKPGMLGLVGMEFGQAQVNIADMSISRRGRTALMLLKIDTEPPASLLERLKIRRGILKVAAVKLPAERS